jgi:tetratricopeptide (TPR) repeat protein
MYNLLIALGASVAAYALGAFVAGWAAGFIPGILALVVTFFMLSRRTMRQMEAVAQAAMAHMQAGRVDEARNALLAALPLGKWQFLVEQQIHGQVGSLDYMQAVGLKMQRQLTASQARMQEARERLEKSWTRDWRSRALLGLVHHRLGEADAAIAAFEGASAAGSGEPIFWGLYTHVLNEARKRDQALLVAGRGLESCKNNAALLQVRESLSNKRRPDFKNAFGEAWFQFFPDDMTPEQIMAMQAAANAPGAPSSAHAPRGRPPKTWPAPRR